MFERRPLAAIGVAVLLAKAGEFLLDPRVLLYPDSGAFLMNALGVYFVDYRSYVYGYLIRIFAVPFHSPHMIVAMQMAMGAFTAWLLAATLMRFFGVGKRIALAAALLFSLDPVQVVHEHMVMAETAALMALAVYLFAGLHYLERPVLHRLPLLALIGTVLVSFRVAYLPSVLVAAVAMPLAGWWSLPGRPRRMLTLGLLVSCGATAIVHLAYTRLTGRLGHEPPGYSSMGGFMLMAAVSPLLMPDDSADPRVSSAVAEQWQSTVPPEFSDRWKQEWLPEGLRMRLMNVFYGDYIRANSAALHLAVHAIRRDPPAFAWLAVRDYLYYWKRLPHLHQYLALENGMTTQVLFSTREGEAVSNWFGIDLSRAQEETPSRRYHIAVGFWNVFLLLSPMLSLAAWALGSGSRLPVMHRGLAFFAIASCLILTSLCFTAPEAAYRFLHPYSWLGLAALATLAQMVSLKRLNR